MLSPSLHFTPDDAAFFSTFVIRNQQANIVWLEGVVDLASQGTLATTASLLRLDPKPVTVDVSRVTFCDCTLIAFLAELAQGHSVQLREPSRLVSDLVAVAGLSRCLGRRHDDHAPARAMATALATT